MPIFLWGRIIAYIPITPDTSALIPYSWEISIFKEFIKRVVSTRKNKVTKYRKFPIICSTGKPNSRKKEILLIK